jgi:phage gpG-like protein
MIDIKATVEPQMQKVQQAADKAAYRNFRHAGFSIAKAAKALIVKSPDPSKPGSPPTTRGKARKSLKSAIFTNSDKESAMIGPRASFVGTSGEVHEFGKSRGGEQFPQRSFMGPALQASLPRFAADWQGSIGE